jgi:hypothetical protein
LENLRIWHRYYKPKPVHDNVPDWQAYLEWYRQVVVDVLEISAKPLARVFLLAEAEVPGFVFQQPQEVIATGASGGRFLPMDRPTPATSWIAVGYCFAFSFFLHWSVAARR